MTRRGALSTVPLLTGVVLLAACFDTTGVPDLNNVSSSTIDNGLNRSTVQLLATGLLNQDRANVSEFNIVFAETMARDIYRLDAADNRFITELVGHSADPGGFIGGGDWTGHWVAIRAANTIIDKLPTAVDLTGPEQAGTRGFARTFKALSYYRALEMRDSLGIPVDVNRPISAPPAPFVCKPDALTFISALLDSAYTDLQTAGSTPFPFVLPGGFTLHGNYATPAAFALFNRGLKGKVELYRGLSHERPRNGSFTDAVALLSAALGAGGAASLDNGLYYTFSTAPGETANPMVDAALHLNPAVGDSLQTGDLRGEKILRGVGPFTGSTVSTTYDPAFASTSNPSNLTRPIPLLRNAELVLLRAQARIESGDLAGATADINLVRTTTGGLAPLALLTSAAAARNAVLYEKRYTLLGEGAHRLVDLRAYSRFNVTYLKKETAEDIFQSVLPIASPEVTARGGVVPTPICN